MSYPRDPGGGTSPPPSRTPYNTSSSPSNVSIPAWQGRNTVGRSYQTIINESNTQSPNILIQFKLYKITNQNNPDNKPLSLSDAQIGEFLFDFLKINPKSCLELDLNTGRYDTRELLLRSGTNLTEIITNGTPHFFKDHEITATILSKMASRVTFRGVPIGVPDEELLHLCRLHGTLVDGKVNRDPVRLGNNFRHAIPSSTRWIDVKLHPGQSLKNFYWLSGPGQGEMGRKVTVLHPNQPRQCSWCLKHPPTSTNTPPLPTHCQAGGNGKVCQTKGTPRASMERYIGQLRELGYTTLKDQHYMSQATDYPSLDKQTPENPKSDMTIDAVDDYNDDHDHDGKEVEVEIEKEKAVENEEGRKEKSKKEVEGKPEEKQEVMKPTLLPPPSSKTKFEFSINKSTKEKVKRSIPGPSIITTPGTPATSLSVKPSPSVLTVPQAPDDEQDRHDRQGSGLTSVEVPLKLWINESKPYKDIEVRQYAVQAIRTGEITFNEVDDSLVPIFSENVLKGCAETATSKNQRKELAALKKIVMKVSRDPKVQEEGKKPRSRKVSEANLSAEGESLLKSVRSGSP